MARGDCVTAWQPDTRHTKTFGSYTLTPERRDGETAHRIDLPDGRSIRVLPDGSRSGQWRAHALREALKSTAALVGVSEALTVDHLVGRLAVNGLLWDWVDLAAEAREAVTIEEWLMAWFADVDASRVELPFLLLNALAVDGWQIVRAS
jgi:hypothetical protein